MMSERRIDEMFDDEQCPNCGMPNDQWNAGGRGFAVGEQTFCCRGCAEDIGCTCELSPSPSGFRFALPEEDEEE